MNADKTNYVPSSNIIHNISHAKCRYILNILLLYPYIIQYICDVQWKKNNRKNEEEKWNTSIKILIEMFHFCAKFFYDLLRCSNSHILYLHLVYLYDYSILHIYIWYNILYVVCLHMYCISNIVVCRRYIKYTIHYILWIYICQEAVIIRSIVHPQ